MNGYALFIKTNLPAFSFDGSLIDARALKLSTGSLLLPMEFTTRRKEPNQPIISVSFV